MLFKTWLHCHDQVDLELETIQLLCQRVTNSWNQDKLLFEQSGHVNEFKERAFTIGEVMFVVVLPRVRELPKKALAELQTTLSDLQNHVPLLHLKLLCFALSLTKNSLRYIASEIRNQMRSRDETLVRDALGVYKTWLIFFKKCLLPKPPKDIFTDLLIGVHHRKTTLLSEMVITLNQVL